MNTLCLTDLEFDQVELDGVKYSREIFKFLGIDADSGVHFQFVRRDGDTITIRRIPPAEAALSASHQRMWDLIRYLRSELHEANLITDDEYTQLLEDWWAVGRLEDYDELRKLIRELARPT